MKKLILIAAAVAASLALAPSAFSADSSKDNAGSGDRWNITGPEWYATECGLRGMTAGVGVGEPGGWIKPCSVPVRACVYERTELSYPAMPDVACQPQTAAFGRLLSTRLITWPQRK